MKTIVTRINPTRSASSERPRAFRERSGDRKGAGLRHLRRLLVEPLEDRTLLASGAQPLAIPLDGGTSSPKGLNPLQVEQAYGFDDITFPGATAPTGTGQTIAIVDAYFDPNIQADVAAFDANYGLPAIALTVAYPDGTPQEVPPDTQGNNWIEETSLDVEWAHALAPGAKILLVETPGGGQNRIDQGLIDGVNYARNQPGVSVVSMSWTESSLTNIDGDFTSPNYDPAQGKYQGITFIAGSGDDGGQAGYPASSPNVLAVGGTTFAATVDANGDYPPGGETAWSYSSGGVIPGVSPPQGQAAVYPNAGGRAAPDVAFDAGTGVVIYDSYDFGTATPWMQIGGTSIGAPAWSALIALADQGRALLAGQGLPAADTGSLDGPSQTIPDLYRIASDHNQSMAFNDVTSGQNQQNNTAVAGYDLVTGLGTPKAAAIAAILSQDVAGPNLNAPQAGSVLTTTALPFEWSPVPGAVSYDLTVTDTATGKTAFTQGGVTGTSYTIPSSVSLAAGLYTWDVTAVMADGQPAAAAPPVQSFTYIPIPVLTGPSGVTASTTPMFQWQAVPGASGYDLRVTNATTGALVFDAPQIAGTSYTPTAPLADSTTYSWTVSADVTGQGGSNQSSPPSPSAYLTVDMEVGVVPITPTNWLTVTASPTFQWSPVANAVSYELTVEPYGGGLGSPGGFDVTVTDPSYTASELGFGAYEWSVTAKVDNDGVTTSVGESYLSDFQVNASDVPPTLISPQSGATVTTTTPTLQWAEPPGSSYAFLWALNLYDVTANIPLITGLGDSGTSYTLGVPLDNGHTYEWSVSGSAAAEFTVFISGGGTESLAAPTPLSPVGVVATDSPTFTWSAVPGAVEYGFYLLTQGTDPYANVVPPTLVTTTSFSPTLSPITGGNVSTGDSWYVTAYDSSGNFSPPPQPLQFFAYEPSDGQLSAPTNLSPGGTVTTFPLDFQWSAVPGATLYTLVIFDETTGVEVNAQLPDGNSYTYNTSVYDPFTTGHIYRWYVYALGGSGDGVPATQTFTLSAPADDEPSQDLPAANAVLTTTSPQFSWSAVPGAVGYLLNVEDPLDGYGGFLSPVLTTTSYTPGPGDGSLLNNRAYLWQVAAVFNINGAEAAGQMSAPLDFTVSAPGVTTLQAPAPNATVPTTTPTLQWSPVPAAEGYIINIEDVSSDTNIDPLRVITTSYTIGTPLTDGDSYRWSVQAYDDSGDIGNASAAQAFSVTVPLPPPPTVNGPIGQVKSPTTTFQVTAVPGATRYTLYIKDTKTGQLPLGTDAWQINGGSYTLPFPPVAGDDYEWYVSAYDAYGNLLYRSTTKTFVLSTTTDLAGPPTPSPLGGPATATPTLQWSPVANAVGYEVQILDVTAGATGSPPSLTPAGGTSYMVSPPLTPGHDYQWQVEAYDQNGLVTPWSTSLTFHVVPSPPGLVSPSGTTQSVTPTFQWSAAAGAAGYQIEIADVTGGGDVSVLAPTKVDGLSYTLAAPLTAGHTYQWQVLAYDSSSADSSWSSPMAFSIPPTNSQSNGTSTTPAAVTGLVGVTHAKKKVSAITIAFDEALESASADSIAFYQVAPETKKRKKIVYGKPVKIAVSYDGSHDVTIRLARPVKGPLRLMVLPGIIAADGAAGEQPYTVTVH